ncbi:MAG: beta-galactosidase [Clostridia bacterium]|nr:beta-galactosidase [Clostridia bacterium]
MTPRSEYPRPQFKRSAWLNLNGQWQFEIDHGDSGRARGLLDKETLEREITVPFCPESRLSGIGNTDFMKAVWYKRSFILPRQAEGRRVFIHFGAVDYATEVWINGQSAGTHRGGYASFSFEITHLVLPGENTVTLCARDDQSSRCQPYGKQSWKYQSFGCFYTRTTGIWQTVWLEYVPNYYIRHVLLTPDVKNEKLNVRVRPERYLAAGSNLTFTVRDGDNILRTLTAEANWGETEIDIPMPGATLWEPGKPYLYGLDVVLTAPNAPEDRVESYFGMRSVEVTPKCVLINGKPVFQRLILDQGFYPDGIYTAPDDSELRADIERSMAMGFNGARLHQKVFEPRFLYWADKLGYLCWGEHASWGFDVCDPAVFTSFLNEWCEIVERDYSSPAIIGWCPFNETPRAEETLGAIYRLTKRLDPSRPVIDTSGWSHHITLDGRPGTDVYDFHDYEQNAAVLAERIRPYSEGKTPPHAPVTDPKAWHPDTPYFCSEFGGTRWAATDAGWGYGVGPANEQEFIERFGSLVTLLLQDPDMCAFCYTQLTDVEQEKNGLYTYERQAKFPPETLRKYVAARAAIELGN